MNERITHVDLAHEMANAENPARTKAALARVAAETIKATHSAKSGEMYEKFVGVEDGENPHENEIADKMLEANSHAANLGPDASGKLVESYEGVAARHDSEANRAGELARVRYESER